MGKLIEKQSFDNFDLSHYSKNPKIYNSMKGNVAKAKLFAEGFDSAYKGSNLLFMGKTGTGKTHISTAIAKVVISKGYDVKYDSAQNIVSAFENDKFKSGYGPHEPTSDKYLNCDLLIIDDLGTEFVNQFTVSCLYNLFNTRRNKGVSTIISTNLSAQELSEKYDDRIYSRIFGSDSFPFYFEGDDYRLYGKDKK
jgi:DNA replication protein DnaC